MRVSRSSRRQRCAKAALRNHSRRDRTPAPRRSRGEWERLVREWLATGSTAREFCERRSLLSVTNLKWWAWKLGLSSNAKRKQAGRSEGLLEDISGAGARSSVHASFLPVKVLPARGMSSCVGASEAVVPTLEVVLHGGRLLRFCGTLSAATLKEIVRILEDAE